MTEEEHNHLVEVGNKFWLAFSKLCAEHIDMMPKHMRAETTMYLGDKTSIYGSCYERFLKK